MWPEAQPGFCEEGGAYPKVYFFPQKFPNLGPSLNRPLQLKRITKEGEQSLHPLGDFCNFALKIAILTPFQSYFARFWSYMNNYSKFKNSEVIEKVKLLSPFSLPYT